MPKRRPPGLKLEPPLSLAKAESFTLSDTGSFLQDSFEISPRGILSTPSAGRVPFSNLQLEELEPLRELGAGASATVRLARHMPTGQLLALKIINVVADREKRKQIMNELRVLCRVSHHPQVVPLYDAFYTEGYVYLALRYMDGGSLEQLLRAYQVIAGSAGIDALGLPERILAAVLLQVVCGLEHLHERRLVHRDLKPANILIDSAGGVAVADFGISKELEETRGMARSFVGTAAYMAPERIRGSDHSAPSDVWSLGVIAVECAQGFHPYRHVLSYYDLIVEIQEAASQPRLRPSHFSAELCEISAKCVSHEPAERPSCAELLAHAYFEAEPTATLGSSHSPRHAWLAGIASVRLGQWIGETFGGGSSRNSGVVAARGEGAATAPDSAALLAAQTAAKEADAGADKGEGGATALATDERARFASRSRELHAAATIQAHRRGSQTRRELEELKELEELVALGVISEMSIE